MIFSLDCLNCLDTSVTILMHYSISVTDIKSVGVLFITFAYKINKNNRNHIILLNKKRLNQHKMTKNAIFKVQKRYNL